MLRRGRQYSGYTHVKYLEPLSAYTLNSRCNSIVLKGDTISFIPKEFRRGHLLRVPAISMILHKTQHDRENSLKCVYIWWLGFCHRRYRH